MKEDISKVKNFTVVFADIAGSTSLYERDGDLAAEKQISDVVNFMVATVEHCGGVLIKTIGDEIMCRFASPSNALTAAVEIQRGMQAKAAVGQSQLKVRIGMQVGPAIMKEGDLFGDTVNVAARMAGLALSDQIITTLECVQQGVPASVAYRKIDALNVKGREQPVDVCEVLWRADDSELTTLMAQPDIRDKSQVQQRNLRINFGGQDYLLNEDRQQLVIGRGTQCDVEVPSSSASRVHAKILLRRGKIVLVDQSTNGTFVKLDTGEELFVHREELSLTHRGIISLGSPVSEVLDAVSDQPGRIPESGACEKFLLSFVCDY